MAGGSRSQAWVGEEGGGGSLDFEIIFRPNMMSDFGKIDDIYIYIYIFVCVNSMTMTLAFIYNNLKQPKKGRNLLDTLLNPQQWHFTVSKNSFSLFLSKAYIHTFTLD